MGSSLWMVATSNWPPAYVIAIFIHGSTLHLHKSRHFRHAQSSLDSSAFGTLVEHVDQSTSHRGSKDSERSLDFLEPHLFLVDVCTMKEVLLCLGFE